MGCHSTEVKVYDDLELIMDRAFDAVFATVRPFRMSLRNGDFIVGVHRVLRAEELLGRYA
jgi:hypothetical protein